MRSIAVTPGRPGSLRLIEEPDPLPRDGEVSIRTLEVGVCGTDRELDEGLLGFAPDGDDHLVLGHEFIGRIERGAGDWRSGDLVSARARRPCAGCPSCLAGAPDACVSGGFKERGIFGLHGFGSDVVTEDPDYLVAVPEELGWLGVLAEPAAVSERGIRHSLAVGARNAWSPSKAVILGGGALALLATFILRLRGCDVWTVARSDEDSGKADIVRASGAHYVQAGADDVERLRAEAGPFDIAIAAVGLAERSRDAVALLAPNGVACLLGVDGHDHALPVDRRLLGFDLVAENRAVIGSCCSNTIDWDQAIVDLTEIKRRWPTVLEDLVGLRAPVEELGRAVAFTAGKATLRFDG